MGILTAMEAFRAKRIPWTGTAWFGRSSLFKSRLGMSSPGNQREHQWNRWLDHRSLLGRLKQGKLGCTKTGIITAIFCVWASLFSQSAVSASAQLIMVEETGCAFCARFNNEIAPIYPNTKEGSIAPLRRVNIDNGWPDDLSHIKTESLTPTFILVQNNQELGRLYGYQGDEFFWFLLGELLEKLKPVSGQTKQ